MTILATIAAWHRLPPPFAFWTKGAWLNFLHRAVSQALGWPSCWTRDLAGGAVWTVLWLLAGRNNCHPHFVCSIPINTHGALQECPHSWLTFGIWSMPLSRSFSAELLPGYSFPFWRLCISFFRVLKLLLFACAFIEFPCIDLEGWAILFYWYRPEFCISYLARPVLLGCLWDWEVQ